MFVHQFGYSLELLHVWEGKWVNEPIHLKFEFFAHVWKINKNMKFSHLLRIFYTFCKICCEKFAKGVKIPHFLLIFHTVWKIQTSDE